MKKTILTLSALSLVVGLLIGCANKTEESEPQKISTEKSTTREATTEESASNEATTEESTTKEVTSENESSHEETTAKELTREEKIIAFVDSIDINALEKSLVCPLCGEELWIGKGSYDDPDTGELMSEDDLFCCTYDFVLSYTIKDKHKVIYFVNWVQNGEVFEYGIDYAGYWAADIEEHRK